jgi:hypothetical protein
MSAPRFHFGFERKIGYSFVGLLAGNTVLLLYFLSSAIKTSVWLRSIHMGEPDRVIPNALEMFKLYGITSMIGWALVGLPFVLLLRANFVARLHWLFAGMIGAALGPLAFLAVSYSITGGRATISFRNSEMLWIISVLISTIAFLIYCALVRRAVRTATRDMKMPPTFMRGISCNLS